MAQVFTTLFNLAMRLERERFLGAGLYERNPDRRGYANGYKSKTLDTTAGTVTVDVPKAAGIDEPFYPQSLERGRRSSRAVMLAIAEMYVQGVSTRDVAKVMAEFRPVAHSRRLSAESRSLGQARTRTCFRRRRLHRCGGFPQPLIPPSRRVRTAVPGCPIRNPPIFVPGREAAVGDALANTIGVAIGLTPFLIVQLGRIVRGFPARPEGSESRSGVTTTAAEAVEAVPWLSSSFFLRAAQLRCVRRPRSRASSSQRHSSRIAPGCPGQQSQPQQPVDEAAGEAFGQNRYLLMSYAYNPKFSSWLGDLGRFRRFTIADSCLIRPVAKGAAAVVWPWRYLTSAWLRMRRQRSATVDCSAIWRRSSVSHAC